MTKVASVGTWSVTTKKMVIACCVVASACVLAWWFWPTPSLDAQARSVMKACLGGRDGYLADRTLEEFFPETGVTPATARRILGEIVLPEFATCTLVQESGSLKQDPLTTGTWMYTVRDQGGREFDVIAEVSGSSEGGRVSLKRLLFAAWRIRYVREHGDLPEVQGLDMLEGLRTDRARLEELGMVGGAELSTGGVKTWAATEATLQSAFDAYSRAQG